MASFNKVMLLGNLTRDVETREVRGGLLVAKLGMAINRRYTSNGEQKESVCYVDMTAFGRQAEVLDQYTRKGSQLFIEGRLEYSQWEDDQGNKRNKLEVVIENFQFTGSRGDGEESGGGGGGGGRARAPRRARSEGGGAEAEASYDDVPF